MVVRSRSTFMVMPVVFCGICSLVQPNVMELSVGPAQTFLLRYDLRPLLLYQHHTKKHHLSSVTALETAHNGMPIQLVCLKYAKVPTAIELA